MSKQSYPILLAGVSLMGVAFASSAMARDAVPVSEPLVLYADDSPSLARDNAPVRMAAAQRGNMGGGFIEFLFNGDQQPQRYERAQPYYYQQQQPQQQELLMQQPRQDAMAPAQQGI